MRRWLVVSMVAVACAAPEQPAQDPLDYLRVGVQPEAEADAIIADLERHGFTVGHKIVEERYTAFDASRGPDSTVRVVTGRGPSFAAQTPDVRAPRRVRLTLAADRRPDFDRDGVRDLVVASREVSRTCLVWLQVAEDGFVTSVFRPEPEWGDLPCVIELDPRTERLWLEVTVPGSATAAARVTVPIERDEHGWALEHGEAAKAHWQREIDRRNAVLAATNDAALAARLEAELAWIEHLRARSTKANTMLEAADDGEEAR